MKWVINEDTAVSHLTFDCGETTILARYNDPVTGVQVFVDQMMLHRVGDEVERQCAAAAQLLMKELQCRFPSHELMDILGVVYSQFWLQAAADVHFPQHLAVLKVHYCVAKIVSNSVQGVEPVSVPLLSAHLLEAQKSLQTDHEE